MKTEEVDWAMNEITELRRSLARLKEEMSEATCIPPILTHCPLKHKDGRVDSSLHDTRFVSCYNDSLMI